MNSKLSVGINSFIPTSVFLKASLPYLPPKWTPTCRLEWTFLFRDNEPKKRPKSTTGTRSERWHPNWTLLTSKIDLFEVDVWHLFGHLFGGPFWTPFWRPLRRRRMDTCTRKEPNLKTCLIRNGKRDEFKERRSMWKFLFGIEAELNSN